MTSPVRHIRFDSALLPETDRLASYCALVPHYDVTPLGDPFEAAADGWFVGELFVAGTRMSPVRFQRSPARARVDGYAAFSFFLLVRGTWTGKLGERLLTAGPGQLVAFDLGAEIDAHGSGTDSIAVTVPRTTVLRALPPGFDLHGEVLDGTAGRLLAAHLMALAREAPTLREDDAGAVADATLGLIRACLGEVVGNVVQRPEAETSALAHRVRRYVDDRLGDADLSPERICRDLGVSRSALYRGFARLGGIAAYIRMRRLEAAHVLLDDPAERRNIGEIAYSFGFVSDAHFSRSFRQRFGYSPREARAGGVKTPVFPAPAAPPDPG